MLISQPPVAGAYPFWGSSSAAPSALPSYASVGYAPAPAPPGAQLLVAPAGRTVLSSAYPASQVAQLGMTGFATTSFPERRVSGIPGKTSLGNTVFDAFDTDNDGKVSRFELYDSNHDGRIDRAEFDAMVRNNAAMLRTPVPSTAAPPRGSTGSTVVRSVSMASPSVSFIPASQRTADAPFRRLSSVALPSTGYRSSNLSTFDATDTNHDGVIQRFEYYDRNHDGRIDRSEFERMLQDGHVPAALPRATPSATSYSAVVPVTAPFTNRGFEGANAIGSPQPTGVAPVLLQPSSARVTRRASPQARVASSFDVADTNHNGVIERFEHYDINHDGRIDRSEFDAMVNDGGIPKSVPLMGSTVVPDFRAAESATPGTTTSLDSNVIASGSNYARGSMFANSSTSRRESLSTFDATDTNHNGVIDKFEHYDSNHDGRIDRAEFDAMLHDGAVPLSLVSSIARRDQQASQLVANVSQSLRTTNTFDAADTNHDGVVGRFEYYDRNHDQRLDQNEVKHMIHDGGVPLEMANTLSTQLDQQEEHLLTEKDLSIVSGPNEALQRNVERAAASVLRGADPLGGTTRRFAEVQPQLAPTRRVGGNTTDRGRKAGTSMDGIMTDDRAYPDDVDSRQSAWDVYAGSTNVGATAGGLGNYRSASDDSVGVNRPAARESYASGGRRGSAIGGSRSAVWAQARQFADRDRDRHRRSPRDGPSASLLSLPQRYRDDASSRTSGRSDPSLSRPLHKPWRCGVKWGAL
eukprot:TRINITY_DN2045_c0_g1_i2.p1 TRINITY_DN2045_c0_g1~~TRINITY_DN2045_c0_g1_i2.p1  ORF type:complete len:750 (+),score=76.04 TRINITY_DN2045_c0_g1_i2:67-2316(+)